MKAIAISEFGGGSSWSSEHSSSWHYSSKRSQSHFHPVNVPQEQFSSKSTTRVSRSLFGPSDPVESRRLECEEFKMQRCSDRSRWNFDFYQEKPIAGRYSWRKVGHTGKDTKHSDQSLESLWASRKSPKSSTEDLKHVSGSSWDCLEGSSFRSKSSSPESKKKTY